ncbi:hypothetical protein [Litorilituus lipolyticus]|uniref:Uncharacterized protein n=1 Tax=Litorilituus lipolyticus TaxID=2491017 RepID=A0A502KXE2_9GAMM|nr:hypothetical protein [Litorilituus lipolyticus]TPH14641.1 hypothetical protein EPA86_11115 [Litorilituus lipolyticus]
MKSKQGVKCQANKGKNMTQLSLLPIVCALTISTAAHAYTVEKSSQVQLPEKIALQEVTPEKPEETKVEETKVEIPKVAEENKVSVPKVEFTEPAAEPELNTDVNSTSAPIPFHSDYENKYIPVVDNAKVFANLTEELPAVLNYFTQYSEEEVITFYQQSYGDALSQERKRGRLTLHYQQNEQKMRVVISKQGEQRQVDVLVEENAE